MKNPDAVSDCIKRDVISHLMDIGSDSFDEELVAHEIKSVERKLERWIEYGEYIMIEFDTDEMTARVVEQT